MRNKGSIRSQSSEFWISIQQQAGGTAAAGTPSPPSPPSPPSFLPPSSPFSPSPLKTPPPLTI